MKIQNAGFDLTDVGVETWMRLLAKFNISAAPVVDTSRGYERLEWVGPEIVITTKSNPLDEDGYASYIGITGAAQIVLGVFMFIKHNAEFIKDECWGRRDFI